jgi:glycosyltransferase involved in cell wall biosynthesis
MIPFFGVYFYYMAKTIRELSVFFPAYNEEGNIEKTVVEELARLDRRIRVVHHKPNRGYGGALKTGLGMAKYEWVAFTDADGQFDFGEIKKFIKHKDEADLILGYRLSRADPFARKVFTFGWALVAKVLLGLRARDYSCGFKMIRKKVFNEIQPLVGEEKVTQIEMLVKARRKGFRFVEVGVHHYPRGSGKQTGANVKVVAKSVCDLFRLWRKLR